MWGGNKISKKWGETKNIALNDGLNQNNHIAVFPDAVHGAAAQFDLWRSSYTGMTLQNAIKKWSGGNSSTSYMNFLTSHTGLTASSQITVSVLSSPTGLKLMKAQAQWEAGKVYPLSDNDWQKAQELVFTPSVSPTQATPTVAPQPTAEPSQPSSEAPRPSPSFLDTIKNWFSKE